jgi:hypothetical protein
MNCGNNRTFTIIRDFTIIRSSTIIHTLDLIVILRTFVFFRSYFSAVYHPLCKSVKLVYFFSFTDFLEHAH